MILTLAYLRQTSHRNGERPVVSVMLPPMSGVTPRCPLLRVFVRAEVGTSARFLVLVPDCFLTRGNTLSPTDSSAFAIHRSRDLVRHPCLDDSDH